MKWSCLTSWIENMPYKECVQRSTFPKLVEDRHLLGKTKDWSPKLSEANGRERIRFQSYSDQSSGGIQYWHKYKHKKRNYAKRKSKEPRGNENDSLKLIQRSKCSNCGGLLSTSDRVNERSYFVASHSCAFGKEYCDVIGPCADCCLEEQRNAIVEKQSLEFPGLEVTPRKLVAPALVRQIISNSRQENTFERDDIQQARSVLELPSISLDTLRHMRREAGSRKQKRNAYSEDKKTTHKKYIEIRLPKIWHELTVKINVWLRKDLKYWSSAYNFIVFIEKEERGMVTNAFVALGKS